MNIPQQQTVPIIQQTLPSHMPLNLPVHTNPQLVSTQQSGLHTPQSKMSFLPTPQLNAFSQHGFKKPENLHSGHFKMKEIPQELKEYSQSHVPMKQNINLKQLLLLILMILKTNNY